MDKSKIPYIAMLILAAAIAGMLLYIIPYRYRLNQTTTYQESDRELYNPLTGYAPQAEIPEECEDSRLVYIGLTWEMWEPSPGEYDIEALEDYFHISRWKRQGKHAVLRFLCDVPGDEEHMDIPEWLYEQTGDGTFYDTEYGKGYSPNYENEYLLERHQMAMEALAEYCNKDDFVAYVELGSLGHWGEWHTNTEEGVPPLPDAEICWDYVLDYSDNFHNARMLMRRNFIMAAEGGMGLYNDMTGHESDTEEWLGWIENGGSFETSGTPLEYQTMGSFWQNAPCGGEFTSRYPMEELLEERLDATMDMVRKTHMTFIGPKCPEGSLKDSEAAQALEQELGYRYYISELSTRYSFGQGQLEVEMTWQNGGLAPLYWDWPVTMYVYDKSGELKYWETVELELSKLYPGREIETVTHIPFTEEFRDGFQIGIGITDPDEEEHLELAMDGTIEDGIQMIYTYKE
ncbi:MAG: DUF4832 domain-containing protein [Lachnospiraceae bacterium]|nr:DUF4832 domain-containing protein [Lachnospiraceae bacterium]